MKRNADLVRLAQLGIEMHMMRKVIRPFPLVQLNLESGCI